MKGAVLDPVTYDESGNYVASLFADDDFIKSIDLNGATLADGATSMRGFCFYCHGLTSFDLGSTIDTSGIPDISGMFSRCFSLTELDLSGMDVSGIAASLEGDGLEYTFYKCTSLTKAVLPQGLTYIGNSFFYNCQSLTEVNIPDTVTTIGQYAFQNVDALTSLIIPSSVTSIEKFAFINDIYGDPTPMTLADIYCYADPDELTWNYYSIEFMSDKGTTIHVPANYYDRYTEKFPDINAVFAPDADLTRFDAATETLYLGSDAKTKDDISAYSTTAKHVIALEGFKPENCDEMFYRFEVMEDIDLSKADLSQTTSMTDMFYNCSSLETIDLSSLDTSEVDDMCCMFEWCESLKTVKMTGLNMEKVEYLDCMFSNCQKLKSIDFTGSKTAALTSMYETFNGCFALKTLTFGSGFNTKTVTNMYRTFSFCYVLPELDLSMFDTSAVTKTKEMFYQCKALKTIWVDKNKWDVSGNTNTNDMFGYCSSLVGANGTEYDSNYIDGSYAVVDSADGPGYLTNYLPSVTVTDAAASSITIFTLTDTNTPVTDYGTLAKGTYRIVANTELSFEKSETAVGEDAEILESSYTGDAYEYYFTVTKDTADFTIDVAAENIIPLADLIVNEDTADAIGSINMKIRDTYVGIYLVNSPLPEKLQAGRSYTVVINGDTELYVEGAEITGVKKEIGCKTYTIEIPEDSTAVELALERDIYADTTITFFDSEDNEIDIYNLWYTGEDLTPAYVLITDGDYELTEGVDYEIEYDGEWTEPTDEAAERYPKFTITGMGRYGGSAMSDYGCINLRSWDVTAEVDDDEHGSLTLEPATSQMDNTIYVYPHLAQGYEIDTITAQGSQTNNAVTLTWDEDKEGYYFNMPNEPVIVTLTTKAEYYTVTWYNDGSIMYSDGFYYGEDEPEYEGDEPEKEGDDQYGYNFAGWDRTEDEHGNITYIAQFNEYIKAYTIVWENWDGEELEVDDDVEYGQTPTYDSPEPTKEGNAQYSYSFECWSPDIDIVTGGQTYTAQFIESVNYYDVEFQDDTGECLYGNSFEYGAVPEYCPVEDRQ